MRPNLGVLRYSLQIILKWNCLYKTNLQNPVRIGFVGCVCGLTVERGPVNYLLLSASVVGGLLGKLTV